MEVQCRSPEVELRHLRRQVVGDRLVEPGALSIVNPVCAEEAGMRQREHQDASGREDTREFGDGDVDAWDVHQHHVREHDVERA